MSIVNLAGYYFVELNQYQKWKQPITEKCLQLQLKGTILLSPEGINLFVAGEKKSCENFMDFLRQDPLFGGILTAFTCQTSYSVKQPFKRMLIKLKKEIITMRVPMIKPSKQERAPSVDPDTLARWISQNSDDSGQKIALLDTRNGFEVEVGTFNNAINWGLKKFGDFPDALNQHAKELSNKTVVTFCTGGIRCEKAALFMQASGLRNVYQLDGGILNYFSKQGSNHYKGECFVFDYRTALTSKLMPSGATQCFACRAVVSEDSQKSDEYIPGKTCPACFPQYQAKTLAKSKLPSPNGNTTAQDI